MAMEATEYAFPFDAEPCEGGYDREYLADDFARYFRAFITSGIIADGGNIAESLQVMANDDMTTRLKKGNLIIDGYRYELMEDMIFHHTAADGVLDRIDRISVTLDVAEREIHAIVREGEYSYNPIAPQCRRTSEHLDYVVADVRVVAGAIKITQANITDTRLNTELCGVAFPFWKLDTKPFFAQLNSFYNEFVLKSDRSYDEFLAWAEEKKTEIITWQGDEREETDAWQEEQDKAFKAWAESFVNDWESWAYGKMNVWTEEILDWFNNIKEQLTDNAAVHLQEQIGNLDNLETESRENLVDAINSLTLSYDETMAVLAGVGQIDIEIKVFGGDSALGKNVTLHNEVTGREVTKEYTGGILTFDVCCGMEHSIHVEGLEEYTTPDMAEGIVVEEGYTSILEITYRLKPLSELSWGKIISISEEGRANTLFRLHETKEIELTTGEKVVLEIVGFNHDTLVSDESKTAGITFGMKDCLVQNYRMNATDTNVGGWKDSEMRNTHIREHLYDVLPEELKAGIKQVNKKTSAGNKSSTIETTADDVWLFSQAELGVTGLSEPYSQEGTAYQAFTGNAERIKRGGINGSTRNYFTRSPYVSNATQFRYITTSGGNSYANAATTSYGMAAGLCV